jgi:hypothetical protein
VLAGGAVATHVLEQSPSPHRHHVARSAAAAPRVASAGGRLLSAAPAASLRTIVHRSVHTPRRPHHSSSRRVLASTGRTNDTRQREPGGFAYLGVPTNTSPPSTSAQAASTSARQSSGGPFSP